MVQTRHAEGQALIESCIVIGLICLLLMGLFQLAQLFMAREILDYAAGRGARAKAVGFNDFMVDKIVRIGAIANAGIMTFPEQLDAGPLAQSAIERARIPLYLGADRHNQLDSILNYEEWPNLVIGYTSSDIVLNFEVSQDMPIRFFPRLFGAFYASETVPMKGIVAMDNHYPLYLQEP